MKQLLTVKDLAELLQCSVYQIYRLTAKRRIPFLRVAGGSVRFDQDEIEQWLAKQRIAADYENVE